MAQGATKPAVLQTGITVQVPLFVEQGQMVKVDIGQESISPSLSRQKTGVDLLETVREKIAYWDH